MIPDGDLIVLTADGVGLVLDATGGRLPAIVHWGAALGPMTAEQAAALATAAVPVIGSNNVGRPAARRRAARAPHRLAGRPGLAGSRAGRQWSPAFTVTAVLVDGEPVTGYVTAGAGERGVPRRRRSGRAAARPGRRAAAVRAGARAGRGDQPRRRAATRSTSSRSRSRCPPTPTSCWTSRAGTTRSGCRSAGRSATGAAPAGEPHGPHRRRQRLRPARGPAGLRLRRRAGSARCTPPGAATTSTTPSASFTGERVLGGGELLLPGEVRLATRRDLHRARGSTARTATGWTRSPAASTATCGPGRGRSPPTARSRSTSGRPSTSTTTSTGCSTSPTAPPRSASSASCSTTAGSAPAATTARASATGWSRPTSGPTGCTRSSTGSASWACSSGCGSSRRWSTPTPTSPAPTPSGSWRRGRSWPVESRHQQVLNLGIPEAYEHVKGQMLALLDEYDIGYIKWDHNRDLVEAGTQTDGGRPGVHAQTLAFYRLLDELRAAHPEPGDRVLLVRRRPGRPRRAGAHRPGVGVGQHRPARPAADAALDRRSCSRRSTWARTSPRAARTRPAASHDLGLPGRARRSSATSASSGTSREASDDELAELTAWIAFYKEQRGSCCTRRPGARWTATGRADPPARRRRPGPVAGDLRVRPRRQPLPRPGAAAAVPRPRPGADLPGAARPRRQRRRRACARRAGGAGRGSPGASFTGAALEHVGVAAPIVHPDQVVLLEVLRE